MNVRLSVLLPLAVFAGLAACAPGDRGWCRTAADYEPQASACAGASGEIIAVAPARIETAAPEDLNKAATGELITGLFVRDLSSCGCFAGVEKGDAGRAGLAVYPALKSLAVTEEGGVRRLREVTVEVRLYKADRLLMEKTYSRTWSGGDAPDYERAWRELLPPAMLEIRRDIIAALF